MSIEVAGFVLAITTAVTGALAALIKIYAHYQEKIEKIRAKNTDSTLSRLSDEISGFRKSVENIQIWINELSIGLSNSRSEIMVLRERLDDTKRMLERFEKTQNDSMKNMIKTEISELKNDLILVRKNGRVASI